MLNKLNERLGDYGVPILRVDAKQLDFLGSYDGER